MKYIKTTQKDASFYFALENLLSHQIDNYLLLWNTKPTVMLGCYQNIYQEVNLKNIKQDHIDIVRRQTGGGTIFTTEETLQYSIIGNNIQDSFLQYMTPVVSAMKKLNIPVEFNSRNDLEINGKKVSGNAQCIKKNRIIQHGSIIYRMDPIQMEKYLTPPKYKIQSKGIKSVHQRITGIKDFTDLSFSEFKNALENSLEIDQIIELTSQDIELINDNASSFKEIDLTQPDFNYQNTGHFKGGHVELSLCIKHGKIENISFTGDFFVRYPLDKFIKPFYGMTLEESIQYLNHTKSPFYDISISEIKSLFPNYIK